MQPTAPAFERHDDRGSFVEVVNRGPWAAVIHGTMKAGARMGNHYHTRTHSFFFLTRGSARVAMVDVRTGQRESVELRANQGVSFPAFIAHTIAYLEPSDFLLLKDRAHDPNDSDIVHHTVET